MSALILQALQNQVRLHIGSGEGQEKSVGRKKYGSTGNQLRRLRSVGTACL
ncbi:MAG: hypothetical protein HY231_10670 [Acidobacteria bacterium]|nr:hypothetical protein [Acidobacteriota bacterium]